jgi:hypothetical protein
MRETERNASRVRSARGGLTYFQQPAGRSGSRPVRRV